VCFGSDQVIQVGTAASCLISIYSDPCRVCALTALTGITVWKMKNELQKRELINYYRWFPTPKCTLGGRWELGASENRLGFVFQGMGVLGHGCLGDVVCMWHVAISGGCCSCVIVVVAFGCCVVCIVQWLCFF